MGYTQIHTQTASERLVLLDKQNLFVSIYNIICFVNSESMGIRFDCGGLREKVFSELKVTSPDVCVL